MVFNHKGITEGNSFFEGLGKKFNGSVSNFVLGNAEESRGFPIIYCSDGFCSLTEYSRKELLGNSCDCRFLYGHQTNAKKIDKIREAFATQTEFKTELVFHKKSGSSFTCLIDVIPIRNEKREVVLFLMSHKEIKIELCPYSASENHKQENQVSQPMQKKRKFSRDVLFHLQRQYSGGKSLPAEGVPAKVGNESQFIPQYKLENAKLPKFMLLHFSRTRLVWDWLILFLVAYIAITVPLNAAFKFDNGSFLLFDLFLEAIFVCDIVINFRTTYIESKTGKLVTNPKEISANYMKRWFVVDVVAATPFELLYLFDKSLCSVIGLLKICRLLRLFRVGRRVSRYIEYTASLLNLMMFSFALLAHWFACIWYVIGYEELTNGKSTGWLYALGNQVGKPFHKNNGTNNPPSDGEIYISALYFVFTSLTTVGFGNIAPNTIAEKTFSVLILILGAFIQSALFGNMTAVIQKLYSARARFHAKASQIKQFVRQHQIDGELRRRIEDWFISHWSISKGVNTQEMLDSFPNELQADICSHLYKGFLSLPCFMHESRGCLRSVSLKIKKAYFSPGELVIKENDAVNAIFYIQRGTVEVIQGNFIVAILGTGDMFGDDISRSKNLRKANGDVRALMYCDILYLTRESMCEVLKHYPDFSKSFSDNIGLSFNLGAKLGNNSVKDTVGLRVIDEEGESLSRTISSNSQSSSDEYRKQEKRKTKTVKKKSSANSKLPLWQQKAMNQEIELTKSPSASLKRCLMRIVSSESEEGEWNDDHKLDASTECETFFTTVPHDTFISNKDIEGNATSGYHDGPSSSYDRDSQHFFVQSNQSYTHDPRTIQRSASDRKPAVRRTSGSLRQPHSFHGPGKNNRNCFLTTPPEYENKFENIVITNENSGAKYPENKNQSTRLKRNLSRSLPNIELDSLLSFEMMNNADRISANRKSSNLDGTEDSRYDVTYTNMNALSNNISLGVLDPDLGIYCSDSASYESCRVMNNEYVKNESDGITSPADNKQNQAKQLQWSHLAEELYNLKQVEVNSLKTEMTNLRSEINVVKNGLDSLTDLIKNSVSYDRPCYTKSANHFAKST